MDPSAVRTLFLSRIAKRKSAIAFLFRAFASVSLFRSRAIRTVCKMEGGQMWSATYRQLMLHHYDVSIGLHSYGPGLFPGRMPEGTRIGNYCSLASGIVVFRRNHPTQRFCQHPFFYNSAIGLLEDDAIDAVRDHPLQIEHDVWIGANAIITPRCRTIGLGAVVGAGSVVTKDVAPFTIVAGSPARKIGERFTPEIQSILNQARWWEFPIDRLMPILPAFLEDASLESANQLLDHSRRERAVGAKPVATPERSDQNSGGS